MSRFWSPLVQTLTPYVPGEQPKIPNLVKLNTNESSYGPSPLALQAIALLGEHGSLCYDGSEFHKFGIVHAVGLDRALGPGREARSPGRGPSPRRSRPPPGRKRRRTA